MLNIALWVSREVVRRGAPLCPACDKCPLRIDGKYGKYCGSSCEKFARERLQQPRQQQQQQHPRPPSGVGAGRRPATPVIDNPVDPIADLEHELAATHIARQVIDGRAAGVKLEMEDVYVGNKVQIIDDQLDHGNRSLPLQPLLHILRFRPLHRKPAQRSISTMAFAIISIHQ